MHSRSGIGNNDNNKPDAKCAKVGDGGSMPQIDFFEMSCCLHTSDVTMNWYVLAVALLRWSKSRSAFKFYATTHTGVRGSNAAKVHSHEGNEKQNAGTL